MTKGITDLRQLQICFQDDCETPGTVVERLIGTCDINRATGKKSPRNPLGLMSKYMLGRRYDLYHSAQGKLSTGDDALTYEQLVYWLSMGTVGGVVPAANGTGWTWTFTPDLDDSDLPDVAHIVYGDNAAQWEGTCGFGTKTKITGAFKEAWQIEMDTIWQNWDNEDVDFEEIAYPTSLHPILGQMTTFSMDTSCAFAALDQKDCYLIDWTLTIPGFHAKYFQDGTMHYNCYGLASRALTWEWTMEFDDTLTKASIWDAWRDNTPLYVQLQATGPLWADLSDNYTVTIQMVLEVQEAEVLDSRDGNDIMKFVGETVYDVDCAAAGVPEWEIEIETDVPAILPACV